jgi:gamma-glutamylcyclotransferase (GGCT)/AIG2-like uncharacterized protein YtfP
MISSDYLFVYGTLMVDADNNMSRFLIKHSEFIEKGYFCGKLYKVNNFPGAVLSDNTSDKVYGSVYKITNKDHVFKVLDAYEGVEENLFKRVIINAFLNPKSISTWVYLYNQPTKHLKLIASGDYLLKDKE